MKHPRDVAEHFKRNFSNMTVRGPIIHDHNTGWTWGMSRTTDRQIHQCDYCNKLPTDLDMYVICPPWRSLQTMGYFRLCGACAGALGLVEPKPKQLTLDGINETETGD